MIGEARRSVCRVVRFRGVVGVAVVGVGSSVGMVVVIDPACEPCDDRPDRLECLTRDFRTKVTVCVCGCWVFGRTDRYGYGQFKFRGRNLIAHRFAYDRLVGEIGDDMTLDHICDRHRNCVNPEHLEQVSRSENSRRANQRRKDQGGY